MNIEQIEQARIRRKSFKVFSNYGIAYLDDCLGGIAEDDFVLIGAESGTGKTELSINIAVECAKKHKVHLFALEAEKDEPLHRTEYKILADAYINDTKKKNSQHCDYRNYILNKLDLSDYETPETLNMVYEKFKNISRATVAIYGEEINHVRIDIICSLIEQNEQKELKILETLKTFKS
jgi:KaiC/GvpD/RAD55 family RecA-like ATPase